MTGGRRAEVLVVLREARAPLTASAIADALGVHPNTVRFHLDALAAEGRVERVRLPRTGPGRPALAFQVRPGMDPSGPRHFELLAAMLADGVAMGPEPVGTAVEAGRRWGGRLVTQLRSTAGRSPLRAETATPPGDGPSPAEPGPQPDGGQLSAETGAYPDDGRLPARPGLQGPVRAPAAGEDGLRSLVDLLGSLGFAPTRPGRDDRIELRHCPFLEVARTDGTVVCALHLGLMQGASEALGAPVSVQRLEPFAAPDLCVAHLTRTPTGKDAG